MAFWFNNFEKLNIKLPKTPKQGTEFLSLSLARYLANLVSTIVYKIIEFSIWLHSLIILLICCSVLIKANSFFSYSKLANCDFKDRNIPKRTIYNYCLEKKNED